MLRTRTENMDSNSRTKQKCAEQNCPYIARSLAQMYVVHIHVHILNVYARVREIVCVGVLVQMREHLRSVHKVPIFITSQNSKPKKPVYPHVYYCV